MYPGDSVHRFSRFLWTGARHLSGAPETCEIFYSKTYFNKLVCLLFFLSFYPFQKKKNLRARCIVKTYWNSHQFENNSTVWVAKNTILEQLMQICIYFLAIFYRQKTMICFTQFFFSLFDATSTIPVQRLVILKMLTIFLRIILYYYVYNIQYETISIVYTA